MSDTKKMMRAGYWDGPYSMTVMDVPQPEVGPDQVKVKVAYCGICENDVWISSGKLREVQPPSILGHEFSGIIVEIGADVKKLKLGDRVACNMQVFCGACWACHNGYEHFCSNITMATGAFAQYSVVSEKACEHVPDDMSLLHASFLELVSAAIHAVENAEVLMGRSLAVIGSGSKAQLEMLLGHQKGAYPVISISPSALDRATALELGADYAIDPSAEDVHAAVMRITKNHGVDRVIESSGIPENCSVACEIAAVCATVDFAANYMPGSRCSLDLEMLRYGKQLRIHTSIQSPYLFERAMSYLPRVNIEKLITAIRPLDELNDAFLQQRDHPEFKIVIKPWKEDLE